MARNIFELEVRNSDGSGNNLQNDDWGQAGTILLRGEFEAEYADGTNTPREYSQPLGPNYQTDEDHIDLIKDIARTEDNITNSYGVNELSAFYGQFITHDMAGTTIPVPIPGSESLFPDSTNPLLSGINRTAFEIGEDGVREQLNGVTHHLDGSVIYGSNDDVARWLRGAGDGVEGAKLLTGAQGNLPTLLDIQAVHADATAAGLGVFGPPDSLVAGDPRVSQQPLLASIQSVWMKEHNHQVDKLAEKYPGLSADELYNAARIIVEAEHQNVIYKEYLASVIGEENLLAYTGYDPAVTPGVNNAFTTVAFRFGHDQQSENIALIDENGNHLDPLNLTDAFLRTTSQLTKAGGLEEVLRGLETQQAQEVDGKIVPSLIDNVLNIPGLNLNLGLLDNIRASDHGIGTLNSLREDLGLAKYASFAELTGDADLQQKLADYYGHIDNVDPWLGGLLEAKVPGSQMGATFTMMITAQFAATAAGDRFFYEERLKDFPELLAEIRGTTFADITMRNSDVEHAHGDTFFTAKEVAGSGTSDNLYGVNDAQYLQADNIIAGDGNDKVWAGAGNDTIWGGEGRDRLFAEDGDDFVYAGTGDDLIDAGYGDDNVKAGSGKDQVNLGDGDDWVNGEDGNDRIDCGKGDDIALGGKGEDDIHGGDGHDQVFGGEGDDKVYGDKGDDLCYGGDGADRVYGGDGNDILNGEGGDDDLEGGKGADTFIFTAGSGDDKITDFKHYDGDKIDVSDLFASYVELETNIEYSRRSAIIDLGDGSSITLMGVTAKAGLTADDFIWDDQANQTAMV